MKADQENDVWPRSFPSASSASSKGSLGARFLASPIFLGKYLFQGSIRIEVGIWRKVNEKEVQTLFGESDCLPCDMGWEREWTSRTDERSPAMSARGRPCRPRV
jgi:hypothetical protein